jgi:hypothetical protein
LAWLSDKKIAIGFSWFVYVEKMAIFMMMA